MRANAESSRRRIALAGVLLVALMLAASPTAARATTLAPGAWSYFGDPRAVYYKGAIYTGWCTPAGHIEIARLAADGSVRVTTLMSNLGQADDHNNPSIVILADGRITAFWSPHSGRVFPISTDAPSHMYYRTSTTAGGMSFGPLHTLPANTPGRLGFTYPNPISMGGRLFLFWRGGGWLPSLSIIGARGRWGKPRVLVRAKAGQRPYAKYAGDAHRIYAAFTDCHVDSCPRNSVYLAEYTRGLWRRVDGTAIAGNNRLPFSASATTKVFDGPTERGRAWVQDVGIASDGSPIVLYIAAPAGQPTGSYWYATYRGGSWTRERIPVITSGISSPGGATLDHETPTVVYLSWAPAGQREVEVLRTPDRGATWLVHHVTSKARWPSVRPVSPRGDPNLDVLWEYGDRRTYRSFSTVIRYQRLPATTTFLDTFKPLTASTAALSTNQVAGLIGLIWRYVEAGTS